MNNSNYIDNDKKFNARLDRNVVQRNFDEARKNGLFTFGEELFNNGYSFEDFVANVIVFAVSPHDVYESVLKQYVNIANFPSAEMLRKIFETPGYFNCIEKGFDRAKRKNNVKPKGGRGTR